MSLQIQGPGDRGIGARHLSNGARQNQNILWAPSGVIAETVSRVHIGGSSLSPTSGTLYLFGGPVLPAGRSVSSISFYCAAGPATPTNIWFCLVDQSLNVLAKTADNGAGAWASNSILTLAISGGYTPSSDMGAYLGIVQAAASPASLRVVATPQANLVSLSPPYSATSTTGLTNPASLGATAGALTGIANTAYAYCS